MSVVDQDGVVVDWRELVRRAAPIAHGPIPPATPAYAFASVRVDLARIVTVLEVELDTLRRQLSRPFIGDQTEMEENLADTLQNASAALHWLGQHRVANALTLLSRWLRVVEIRTLDDLEAMVDRVETGGA